MAYINKIRKDGVIYDIQAQGGGSSDSEVTQEYIEELGKELGRPIFPIKDIALYNNGNLVTCNPYEDFLNWLIDEEGFVEHQSLYIDNRGGYFLLPKDKLSEVPSVHIVEDASDPDGVRYDRAFDIVYVGTFDNDEHYDVAPFFLRKTEETAKGLNELGQMVSIRLEYWNE